MIIDISHHQDPAKMDYDKLAAQLKLVIIRTQYGSKLIDRHYKAHHAEFAKRGIPRNVYAYVRGTSVKDMEQEATDFYNRSKEFNPPVWWLDIETKSMTDMRSGIKAFVSRLRALGAKKVGAYIGHTKEQQYGVDLGDFDCLWVPRYGANTGKPDKKPNQECDIWQYTDKGRLNGYSGNLDLNQLTGRKPIEYFTEGEDGEIMLSRTLRHGMTGEDVGLVQEFLKNLGYYTGPVDKSFGPGQGFLNAVKAFQAAEGLDPDGSIGILTRTRIIELMLAPKETKREAELEKELKRYKDFIAQLGTQIKTFK